MTQLIIDADTHLTEPPDVWTDRLDTEFRDRAPILAHPPGMGATIVIDVLPGLEMRFGDLQSLTGAFGR